MTPCGPRVTPRDLRRRVGLQPHGGDRLRAHLATQGAARHRRAVHAHSPGAGGGRQRWRHRVPPQRVVRGAARARAGGGGRRATWPARQ
eukprot:1218296-Prymnesium_polylepis.1